MNPALGFGRRKERRYPHTSCLSAVAPAARQLDETSVGTEVGSGPPRRHPRRVLLISYSFPPVGGAGVQRAAKFVKYLPQYGWHPVVLTVDNPSVPVTDTSLASDLPSDCRVIRTRTWEPSYQAKQCVVSMSGPRPKRWKSSLVHGARLLLQPDPQCLWTWPTRWQRKRVDAEGPYDAVVVSGPPFSTFELGRVFSRRYRIPLLLDFRDEWLLSVEALEHHQQGPLLRRWHWRLFRRALQSAQAITATTQASADFLHGQCQSLGTSARVQAIYNGFDPDDFAFPLANENETRGTPDVRDSDRKILAYHGTLWNLTDCAPLIEALARLEQDDATRVKDLTLRIVGRVTEGQQAIVNRLIESNIRLDQRPYVPHVESVRLANQADVLVLLLAASAGAERVVPAKLFEYLALGRPILAIAPPGEATKLLERCGRASVFAPSQIDDIARWLRKQLLSHRIESIEREPSSERCDLRWCARPELTRQLAGLLDDLVKNYPKV